jgi:hypothetical protein
MPTIAVPRTISASPAMLPSFWPGNDRVRPAKDGTASSRNRSNFSTRNPNAITAMAVRLSTSSFASLVIHWTTIVRIVNGFCMNPYKYERLILVKHESNGNSSEGIWEKHMDP